MSDTLIAFGWNPHFENQLAPGEDRAHIARVVQEHREAYLVCAAGAGLGNVWAEISGKMRHAGAVRGDFPAVGDWVLLRGLKNASRSSTSGPAQITRILERSTTLSRRLEGNRDSRGSDQGVSGDDQVLAVNVDIAFLGASLNENFNLRRLERYLALTRDARSATGLTVKPVILLTKADLCPDPAPFLEQIRAIAGSDCDIHPISVVTGQGMDSVRNHLQPGRTAVILGSSGIGKSTLVNYLAESDLQDMMDTRDFDDKGRHCTTFRHLVRTATGGLIIDTPGLRGLALGEATDALAATFADIDALAATCRFTNCRHETEPGCAIKAGLESGTVNADRLDAYMKLGRETVAMARRENRVADRKQKKLEKKSAAVLNKKSLRRWE